MHRPLDFPLFFTAREEIILAIYTIQPCVNTAAWLTIICSVPAPGIYKLYSDFNRNKPDGNAGEVFPAPLCSQLGKHPQSTGFSPCSGFRFCCPRSLLYCMANLSVISRETGASPIPLGCMHISWLSGNGISPPSDQL